MPRNIIDELRNKYSVFRTRYDDAFIAKREKAAQRADNKKKALRTAARTSLDEINLAERDRLREVNDKAAEGGAWRPLSPEIIEGMARIGLESEGKSGRKLPEKARVQFELIGGGFEDDVIAANIVEEDDEDEDEDEYEDEDEDEDEDEEEDGDEEEEEAKKAEVVDTPEEKSKL